MEQVHVAALRHRKTHGQYICKERRIHRGRFCPVRTNHLRYEINLGRLRTTGQGTCLVYCLIIAIQPSRINSLIFRNLQQPSAGMDIRCRLIWYLRSAWTSIRRREIWRTDLKESIPLEDVVTSSLKCWKRRIYCSGAGTGRWSRICTSWKGTIPVNNDKSNNSLYSRIK